MDAIRDWDIVCFSNDWDGDPLSKTHLMRILSRDHRVLWVNSLGNRSPRPNGRDALRAFKKLRDAARGVREVEPNLHVLAPLYVPAYGVEAIGAMNRGGLRLQIGAAMRRIGISRPVTWAFLPSAEAVAGRLDERLVVYHVVDEFSAFSDASAHVADMERRLLARADLVIASSEKLRAAKAIQNPHTVLVRHGVDFAHFSRALDPATPIPAALAELAGPCIGFFGLVADWIDLELIREVADAYPKASVVLIGKVVTGLEALRGARNIHLLGRKPYADLPSYCKGFSVSLVPFRLNELALNANPLKARESVAAGLPTICTDLPELRAISGCTVARSRREFVARVGEALERGGPSALQSERMRGESWEARVEEIQGHLAELLAGRTQSVRATAPGAGA